MTTSARLEREQRITEAAYELLAENGYRATSMLNIAKRAKASNETLYRWYGNKQGLFKGLVEANAAHVAGLLEAALEEGKDPTQTLAQVGPLLIELVTSEKAVALNRAAAADATETGMLGQALAQAGRERIAPLIVRLLDQAIVTKVIHLSNGQQVGDAADIYISLLIGDLQVRRVTGAIEQITPKQISERAARALQNFLRLYSPPSSAER